MNTSRAQAKKSLPAKRTLSVSVRDLVDFVLRTGNLGGGKDFVSPTRAFEGTRGHQKIQKTRPENYDTEVAVRHKIETEAFNLIIRGRIDGVIYTPPDRLHIEEIKTVQGAWVAQADPLHWAQGKIYGYLYSLDHPANQIEIQLTYFHLNSGQITEFCEVFSAADLQSFFEGATRDYLEWIADYLRWCHTRDSSIQALSFPFDQYRQGQRALAVAVYRALTAERKLFAEAPTGIGKTISVLFPAAKALGEGHFTKLFYLTAKTIGRTVAEKAMSDMRQKGLRLRSITLTAKEKICFSNDGLPCDMSLCPFAIGYYDRIKAAVRDALTVEELTRPVLEEIARRHQVCPFELSLDVSLWVDVIICDYNYVFDPKAFLRRYFAEESGDYAFLIDEAHNLVERAREMFSAELDKKSILEARKAVKETLPHVAKTLSKINSYFLDRRQASLENTTTSRIATTSPYLPEEILPLLDQFQKEAEAWLIQDIPAPFRQMLLDTYFEISNFSRTAALYDDHFMTIFESDSHQTRLRLFCLDPSKLIQEGLNRGKAAVFFSATLTPLDYFQRILGGTEGDPVLKLSSPFPRENLETLIHCQIGTSFKERSSSYEQVAAAIAGIVEGRTGNYLAYFPSYSYLNEVLERFRVLRPNIKTVIQSSGMKESERDAFIGSFQSGHTDTLLGFAVIGGVFGEGIDLIGDRLIGAVIVGVGLPQLSMERDLIRDYFDRRQQNGFDYAYVYPGINRVLQAVGRVIRTETDRGVVLLIDKRFLQPRYRELLPPWWDTKFVNTAEQATNNIKHFWGEGSETS